VTDSPSKAPISLLAKHPWVVFVLPWIIYMIMGQFEPKPPTRQVEKAAEPTQADTEAAEKFAQSYPLAYTMKMVLTGAALAIVFPVYRAFPFWIHKWAIPVGVLGGVFWILACRLQLDAKLFELLHVTRIMENLGFGATRPMFNPHSVFASGSWMMWLFLGVRLAGLVVIVPMIEEFFLRGFLIRIVSDHDWLKFPIGKIAGVGIGIMLLYAVGTHPQELIASVVWFSAVTMFVAHSRNIWDAVTIHILTNFSLGIYILVWEDWTMW